MYMSYKGKYRPENPRKYKGDPANIVYRSLWERKFMRYCDLNENVNQWQSEEFCIPYVSPIDNKVHRYYPDFFVRYTDKFGKKRSMVIEVKPQREVEMLNKILKGGRNSGHTKLRPGQSIKQSGKRTGVL